MKVRDLKEMLEKSGSGNSRALTSVSHWVKKVFESDKGRYTTMDLIEVGALENLAGLGIVSLEKGDDDNIIAELTKEGKELMRDFTGLGYYL